MTISDSVEHEYKALATGTGFVELKSWSTVTMTGNDRQSFLHNMCTNDIRRLSAGEGCEAFCTDVKGRIVAQVFVLAREERLDLLTVPSEAGSLIAHLDRYIIREDVQLEDQSSAASWYVITGVKAEFFLSNLTAGKTTPLKDSWQHATVKIGEAECLAVRTKLFWSGGYLFQCPSAQKDVVTEALKTAGARSLSSEVLTTLRIESGLPLFNIDFSIANLPQEVDRDQYAISFNKGCYLGQETIARIDALGHVNQKVVLIEFDENSSPSGNLNLSVAGKSVGQVTSCCWSPRAKRPLALAMVRRGANKLESQLESAAGTATLVAAIGLK